MSNYEQHDKTHDDSIREENESPQLVQDLHSLYDTQAADAQSLSRIRSRLIQRASIPLPDREDDNIITFQSLDAPEKSEGEMISFLPSRRLHEWRNARRHWPRLVSEIAALVVITALIGSIVLVFSLRPHAPAHNGLLPAYSNGQIQQIHMVDTKTGWSVVQTKHGSTIDPAPAIMRTTDGGHTWYDVTPPELLNQWGTGVEVSQATITDFLSANTAWIALVPLTADKASLYFTIDAGKTWQNSLLPAITFKDSITQMSFIDEQHGWLLTSSVAATPQFTEDTQNVTLFQTDDSGKTWLKVSESNASRPLSDTTRGPLPLTGMKTGFTFINAQTGWMVGQTQQAKFFWFYITHDGGRTWQHQNLPRPTLPASLLTGKTQFQLQPPTFFGSENGVIPFAIPIQQGVPTSDMNAADGEIVGSYVTKDGGYTWQGAHSIQETNIATLQGPQIVNTQDAISQYAIYAEHNYVTFQSIDTSSYDHSSSPVNNPPVGIITQFSFVSSNIGWVLVNNLLNQNSPPRLYETTDGGQTWTHINYAVTGQHVQTSQKLNKGWTAVANYSGTGSKVMFLRGQIMPSKQWWLVYSCSGTGYFSTYSPELHFAGDVPSCSATSTSAHSGSAGEIQQKASTPVSIQVLADSGTTWSVLVVECTDSHGCKGSPIG